MEIKCLKNNFLTLKFKQISHLIQPTAIKLKYEKNTSKIKIKKFKKEIQNTH